MDDAEPQPGPNLSPRAQQLKDRLLGEFSLSVDDVAGILEVDRSTVYRYIQDGALAALKIGREYRLSEVDVEGFLQVLIARERQRVSELRTTALAAAPQRAAAPEAVTVSEPGPEAADRKEGPLLAGLHGLALDEARRTGHRAVQPGHLLLALLSAGDCWTWDRAFPERVPMRTGMARVALERLGADLPALRAAVEAGLPPPDGTPGEQAQRDLSAEAQVVRFKHAHAELEPLGRRWAGTDCLLLGMYRDPGLAEALRAAGADEEAVRAEFRPMAAVLAARPPAQVRFGELARHLTREAANAAATGGAPAVQPEHLLLALTEESAAIRDGLAYRALEEVHADIPAIRAAALGRLGPQRQPAGDGGDGRERTLPAPAAGLRAVVFERAPAAARGLGHGEVGTEHLLLGLYSVPEVAELLEQAGAAHSAVRVAIRRLAPAGAPQPAERRPLFGRYSERSQRTITRAQEEARRLGTGHVGTEHILLALLADDNDGLARKALAELRVDVAALRQQVAAQLPAPRHPGGGPKEGALMFTPRGKALIMEHSLAAARAMGMAYVGTEHLLLGIYDASEPLGRLLEQAGAVREGVEAEVLRLMGGGSGPSELPLDDAAASALDLARTEARHRGHTAVQPEHILIGLLELKGGAARQLLDRLAVDGHALRASAEASLPKGSRAAASTRAELNPDGKAVVAGHAVAAARAAGRSQVGTEHLLLGLHGIPALSALLSAAGAPEDAIRIEVARLKGS